MVPGDRPGDPVVLSEADLLALLAQAFVGLGVSRPNADAVAAVVAAAERDGALSHGLLRMPGYEASLRAGWVDGHAAPSVEVAAPSVLAVDGCNGFAQPALAAVRDQAMDIAAKQGLCTVLIRHSHHFAALWPDVEPFAEAGMVALASVTSRPHMVAWGSRSKVVGTNPFAFAFPRPGGPPVIWDQASSVRAQGEVVLARREGRRAPPGVGVDAAGRETDDPAAILDGGALLPFAGAKGANIALMAEVLVSALGGAGFGFEMDSSGFPGAQTSLTGQFLLLIDPARSGRSDFLDRIGTLLGAMAGAGVSRLPADQRYARRAESRAHGIAISADRYDHLLALARD